MWYWGLQRHFSTVSLQAFLFCLFSFWKRLRSLPLLVPKATKKRSHTTPPLPWAMADCAFGRQRKIVYQYLRPSVVNNLLRPESDITSRVLAYSLSADIVNTLLSPSLIFCRHDIAIL